MKAGSLSLLLCLLLAACEGGDSVVESSGVEPGATPASYQCDGYRFLALAGASRVTLWLEGEKSELPRVPSASGSKYQDGELIFWSKGSSALLEWGEQRLLNCQLVPGPGSVPEP